MIALNARAAARPELGGVERWARELAARLPARAGAMRSSARPRRSRTARPRVGAGGPPGAGARRARLLLNPANLAPLAFPRNAVVIHDAAALRQPGWYSALYSRWQRGILPLVARRARLVITVSEFSRRELAELLRVEAAVVPGGIDARFSPDADPEPARAALGLTGPYVLTVASRTARKNAGALETTARRLAATASISSPPAAIARSSATEHGATAVRALGHVPDEHLPGLYAGAALRAAVLATRASG